LSATLTLRFTRLSPTHHRFEYRRADGSGEAVKMESEGLLIHDLLHYAVEREAGLKGSFYGILGKIGGYEELSVAGGAALGGEMAITERLVGAFAEALREERLDDGAFVATVAENLALYEERNPRWFTPMFILAAGEKMRRLLARWEATAVGETMELIFPAAAN
jgi:hypothetical protein